MNRCLRCCENSTSDAKSIFLDVTRVGSQYSKEDERMICDRFILNIRGVLVVCFAAAMCMRLMCTVIPTYLHRSDRIEVVYVQRAPIAASFSAGTSHQPSPLIPLSILAFPGCVAIVRISRRFGRGGLLKRIARLRQRLVEVRAHLETTEADLKTARDSLHAAQETLIATDALASLGQLTAGIAHEIKNPMNFVNNFAESTVDIVEELRGELEHVIDEQTRPLRERIAPLLDELVTSARKIREHGTRVDGIVRSMLLHSHGKIGQLESVMLNDFLDQYVTLAFHGMRAQIPDFSVTIERVYDPTVDVVSIIRQDLARVFVNLLNNAFQAVDEKSKSIGRSYEPLVRIRTKKMGARTLILFEDNGPGVPEHLRARIFEPFFTTKLEGTGTGLGLALCQQCIVQGHNGAFRYEGSELGGAAFIIDLPD